MALSLGLQWNFVCDLSRASKLIESDNLKEFRFTQIFLYEEACGADS